MGASQPKKLVWIYEDDHSKQPFICLTKECLICGGNSVVILDSESRSLHEEHDPAAAKTRNVGNIGRLRPGPAVAELMWRLWNWCNCPWFRVIPGTRSAAKGFRYLWMAARAVSERPQIIIATGLQGAAIGWLANLFSHSRMVYYPLELYGEQHNHLRWWWKPFEKALVRHGIDALVTQNQERARIYVAEKGASVTPTIVHNYKPWRAVQPSGRLRELLHLSREVRIVLYEGLLGRGRWLDNLAWSAAHLPDDVRLVFMGKPSDWWVKSVQPILSEQAVARRVLMAPWVPHAELPGYVADADVGVIIYDDSVRNNYYCEPGKLSDYVLAGVPVIAPSFPTIQPIVQRYNLGVVFEDPSPQGIAGAIRKVLATPKAFWQKSIEAAERDLIWETQYPALEAAILGESSGCCQQAPQLNIPQVLNPECQKR